MHETDAVTTRESLHVLAEHVLCAARHAATGRIGLRQTPGGFGTPPYPSEHGDQRVRIDGVDLVVEDERGQRRSPITTLRAAGVFVGIEPGAPSELFTPTTPLDLDAPLAVDPAEAAHLAEWYRLVNEALEMLRTHVGAGDDAIVQLWPEHFDLAVALDEVNFGGALGDAAHPTPYLYVGPWTPPEPDGGFWSEPFGSSLDISAVGSAADAFAYFERGRELLNER